jgi:hypothetical protein
LNVADPVQVFVETLQQMLSSQDCHLKTCDGGAPSQAHRLGWTITEQNGHAPTYKANGPRIGWVDWDNEEIMIDPGMFPLIKKHSDNRIGITPQTLLKRLKDAAVLARIDDSRQRNTVRQMLEGQQRNVIVLSSSTLDQH